MKILIPVDFSDASENTMRFAGNILAGIPDVAVILMHSIYITGVSDKMISQLENIIVPEAARDLELLSENFRKETKNKIAVNCCVKIGKPQKTIIDTIEELNVDLIIMGTEGASEIKRSLLGSVARDVIENSSIPVIAVPAVAEISKLKKIIYATDLKELNNELATVALLSKLLKAELTVLHILNEDISFEHINVKDIATMLREETGYDKIKFFARMSSSIPEGITEHLKEEKQDEVLLVMCPEKKGFAEKLMAGSNTESIVLKAPVPLMAVPKREED
jgi:nucleotide-binding universal stress UspA family protein